MEEIDDSGFQVVSKENKRSKNKNAQQLALEKIRARGQHNSHSTKPDFMQEGSRTLMENLAMTSPGKDSHVKSIVINFEGIDHGGDVNRSRAATPYPQRSSICSHK